MKKECIHCYREKKETEFRRNNKKIGNICKDCARKRDRGRRVAEDPIKKRERLDRRLILVKERRKKTPEKFMLYRARKRAVALGLPFNIELSDIKIPKFCPVLGIPLKISDKNIANDSPSLDKIDNKKGYVKGNIAVISFRANGLKRDMSIKDVKN